jgi:tetratricopeptide (TPR) repeat protein
MDDGEATVWRARIRSNLGGVRLRQGRFREAITACRQAIAEAESVGELSALGHACYALDVALVQSGRPDEATHSWRALEIYQELGDPEHEFAVLNNLGAVAYFEGRWDDAVALYRRARVASERAGLPVGVAASDSNIGEILSDQGHLDEAEADLLRARRVWSATGDTYAAYADMLLGRLAVRKGLYDEGLPILEQAAVELRQFGLDYYAGFSQALIAEAEAFRGDPFRAMEVASRELQANDQLRPLLTRVAGIALARLGQEAAAMRELTHSLNTARERNAAYDTAAVIDAMDALGQADAKMLAERDEILARLKIVRLPSPLPPRPAP